MWDIFNISKFVYYFFRGEVMVSRDRELLLELESLRNDFIEINQLKKTYPHLKKQMETDFALKNIYENFLKTCDTLPVIIAFEYFKKSRQLKEFDAEIYMHNKWVEEFEDYLENSLIKRLKNRLGKSLSLLFEKEEGQTFTIN
jgi:hypothetical protein